MADKIERALVVTAHPDDSEFGTGGTVAKLAKDGCEVTYVVVTNGNKGSGDRTMTPERLAAIRADEQRNAARTLGVARVEFLGYPDGEVEDTRDVRRDVAREIRKWRPDLLMRAAWLAVLSVLLAAGAIVAYVLLIRVPLVRNHPEGYIVAFAVALALAVLAVMRGRGRRWPAWIAVGVTGALLLAGGWFNFVIARVPGTGAAVRVGAPAPDFTLPDAKGRPVSLAEFRGKKPVVLVFYRGYW